jgi:hypothetical protein
VRVPRSIAARTTCYHLRSRTLYLGSGVAVLERAGPMLGGTTRIHADLARRQGSLDCARCVQSSAVMHSIAGRLQDRVVIGVFVEFGVRIHNPNSGGAGAVRRGRVNIMAGGISDVTDLISMDRAAPYRLRGYRP